MSIGGTMFNAKDAYTLTSQYVQKKQALDKVLSEVKSYAKNGHSRCAANVVPVDVVYVEDELRKLGFKVEHAPGSKIVSIDWSNPK